MRKRERSKGSTSKKVVIISTIAVVIVLALTIFLFSSKTRNNSQDGDLQKNYKQISPVELVENKEKYEGQNVELENVLVPDPLFMYITKSDGVKERLFIEPKKSEYCLYFNLKGSLQRDTRRDWIFSVDEFICVNKN
jgi:flagellar basal body-associated protein FliL